MSFYCYLLKSVKTPNSTSTYIGFTVDNQRRLRQHNGELTAGAKKTSKGRPWEHIAIVSGFPNKIVALQFEWQWQHPATSRLIREVLNVNPNKRGVRTKLDVLLCILQTKLWHQLDLQVNFLNKTAHDYFFKISENQSYIPRTVFCGAGLKELPVTNNENKENNDNNASFSCTPTTAGQESNRPACELCQTAATGLIWSCTHCSGPALHTACLASICGSNESVVSLSLSPHTHTHTHSHTHTQHSHTSRLIPQHATCPQCHTVFAWKDVALSSKRVERDDRRFAGYRYPHSNTNTNTNDNFSPNNVLIIKSESSGTPVVDDYEDLCYGYEDEVEEVIVEL